MAVAHWANCWCWVSICPGHAQVEAQRRRPARAVPMVAAAEAPAGQTGLLALLQTPFSCRPKPFTDAQCQ